MGPAVTVAAGLSAASISLRPDALDWVLVGLAALALLYIWTSLRAATRVGPIEVELLQYEGAARPSLHALTALLRERLANSGLSPPPAVPAGAPEAQLIAAVEASEIPQAAWIAKLVPALPKPPQYRLSATLLGENENEECGISIWLRPSHGGQPLLHTLPAPTHEGAVIEAASKIYLHIVAERTQAFPVWARWSRAEALERYAAGCDYERRGDVEEAITHLSEAVEADPGNALAQLQRASLVEQKAGENRAEQAAALRLYLDIAVEWPWLVQARYRTSVIAGGLTSSTEGELTTVKEALGSTLDSDELVAWLHRSADRESQAVLELLRPWYVLLRLHRPRCAYEPKADERRTLKRAVSISRHCLGIRSIDTDAGWLVDVRIRYREAAVQGWHLFFGIGGVNWQSHYLAACFDALLLAREERLGAPPLAKRHVRRRRRAFRHLAQAIQEGGAALSGAWIETDPDLRALREPPNPEWNEILRDLGSDNAQALASLPSTPEAPWPAGEARARAWLGFALACVAGAVAVVITNLASDAISNVTAVVSFAVLSVVAVVSSWRGLRAKRQS